MSIDINIMSNLAEMETWIRELGRRDVPLATKRSLLATLPTLKRETRNRLKQYRKMPSGKINKRFRLKKALRGDDAGKMFIDLGIKKRPPGLIEFVKGAKKRQVKRGVEIKKRRQLKVEVFPGRLRNPKGTFIEKANGSLHVFRRQTKNSHPIARQSVSFSKLFNSQFFRNPIIKNVAPVMPVKFKKAMNDIIKRKIPKERLK